MEVKTEVDPRPPQGAGLETTLVRRRVLPKLQLHDEFMGMMGLSLLVTN